MAAANFNNMTVERAITARFECNLIYGIYQHLCSIIPPICDSILFSAPLIQCNEPETILALNRILVNWLKLKINLNQSNWSRSERERMDLEVRPTFKQCTLKLEFRFWISWRENWITLYLPKSERAKPSPWKWDFNVSVGRARFHWAHAPVLGTQRVESWDSCAQFAYLFLCFYFLQIYSSGQQFTLWPHIGIDTAHIIAPTFHFFRIWLWPA